MFDLIFVATEQGKLLGSRGLQVPARDDSQSMSAVPDGSASWLYPLKTRMKNMLNTRPTHYTTAASEDKT
jgi:hypothetical protein